MNLLPDMQTKLPDVRNAYVCRCLTNQDITGGGGSDLYVRVNALKDVQSSLTRYVTVTKYEQKDLSDRQVLLILFELFFEAHDDYRAYKQSSCDLYGLGEGEGGRGEGGGGRGVEMGREVDMDEVGAALRRRGGTGGGGGGGMKASSLSLIGRHVSSPQSLKMPSSPSSPSSSSSPPSSSFFAGLGPFSGTSTSPFSSASSDAMSSTSTSPPSNPLAHTRSHAHVLAHALSYLPSSQPTSAKHLRQEKEEINNDDENGCEKEIMKDENSKKKIGEENDVSENRTNSENDEIYNDQNMDTQIRNEIEKEREVGKSVEKAKEEKSDKSAKKKNATLFTESLKSVAVGAATTPKKQSTPSPGGLIRVQCSPLRLFTRSPHRRKIGTAVGVLEEKEEGRGEGDGGGGGEGEIDGASLLAGEGEGEKEEREEGVYNTSVSKSASLSEERGEDRNGGGGGGGRVESKGYSLSLPPIYSESNRIVRIRSVSADVAELSDENLTHIWNLSGVRVGTG